MFLMVIGFSFGFMIMNYGHGVDETEILSTNQTDAAFTNNTDTSSIFEAPWKNIVKTLAMSMGEFNSMDLYDSFKKDKYSRAIAMMILVLLMMFGTIAMINLFITVIVSDLEKLKIRVFRQNIVNMAQYAILVEDINPIFILK